MKDERLLKGEPIASGIVEGEILVSKDPINFYMVSPEKGTIIEQDHALTGQSGDLCRHWKSGLLYLGLPPFDHQPGGFHREDAGWSAAGRSAVYLHLYLHQGAGAADGLPGYHT